MRSSAAFLLPITISLMLCPFNVFAQPKGQPKVVSSCELLTNPDKFLGQQIRVVIRLEYRPGWAWMLRPHDCGMNGNSPELMDLLFDEDADLSKIGGQEKLDNSLRLLSWKEAPNCLECPAYDIKRLELIGTAYKRDLSGIDGPIPAYYLKLQVAESINVRKKTYRDPE